MNDAMLKLFAEHEKTDGPPPGLDSDTLARKGRKRLMLRRWSMAGGLTAAVAVVAVAAVTLTGLATPSPADLAAEEPATQPEYPLPDLPAPPDGQQYAWGYKAGEKTSAAADEYGTAFQEWFSDQGIDLPEWPGMTVNHRALFLGADWEWKQVDDSVPYYGIATRSVGEDEDFPMTTDRLKSSEANFVGLKVYPRGSFEPGTGDTYEHLATCKDGLSLDALGEESVDARQDAPISLTPSYDCDEATGPDGERILRIETTWAQGDFVAREDNQVIVVRDDGTAVMVDVFAFSDDETDDNSKHLDLDGLTDLALSMPDAIVED